MNSSPGALLLLLLAVYLLLAFFTGRLEWLLAMGRDVREGYQAPPTTPAAWPAQPAWPVQTAAMPPVTAWDPRFLRNA